MSKALIRTRNTQSADFARRLVAWQKKHGRHDLPWQGTRDPYRVWLSEIMLQQTQVSTVMAYYLRFLDKFPAITHLAQAQTDEVMALWAGLGYYSRARNLHRCAQQVVQDWGGQFPDRSEDLQQLAGIGPSTAAAIASICFGERAAIFDGNVQRVLARHVGFTGDLSVGTHMRELREHAVRVLPSTSAMPTYTQAIMDLGATVCSPKNPHCDACPVATDCLARAQGMTQVWPIKTRKIKRQSQSWWLLVIRHPQRGWWLQRRPTSGIWSGLHCFPVFDSLDALRSLLPADAQLHQRPAQLHVLTHRDLHLHLCEWQGNLAPAHELDGAWHPLQQALALGLPKPVLDYFNSARDGA
jgi:A/G-specific adenine glycosylase